MSLLHQSESKYNWQFCSCLQVIPEELCCSAYAFDRGIFGLLGAISAPLVNPHTDAIQNNSVVQSVHAMLSIGAVRNIPALTTQQRS